MLRRVAALIALSAGALTLAPVMSAQAAPATVHRPAPRQICSGIVTGDGVRVRTQPPSGTVLGLLYRGDVLNPVESSRNGWWYGYSPRLHKYGWVSAGYLRVECD